MASLGFSELTASLDGGGGHSFSEGDRLPGARWLLKSMVPKKGGLQSMSGRKKGSKIDFFLKILKKGGV